MQLDQTHVAIRVRTLSEIGDLALLMIRRYPLAFFHCFFIGAIPWIILNAIVLSPIIWQYAADLTLDADGIADHWRYIVMMTTLVVVQTPIAGVFSTYYLGQAVFEQRPTIRKTLSEVVSIWKPIVWILGIRRLAIPLTIYASLRLSDSFNAFFDVFVPIILLVVIGLLRGARPFVAEMIVLERCPLREKKNIPAITLSKRSKALHAPMASELGSRFLTVAFILLILVGSVFYTLMFSRGITLGLWAADATAMFVLFPLALWLVASLSVIVRLLGYLDTRIRLEGWEVELAIRAEAIRQFGDDAMPTDDVSGGKRQLPTGQRLVKAGVTASLMALFFIHSAQAESPQAGLEGSPPITVTQSPWFDAEEQTVRPVTVVDESPTASHRDTRWTQKPKSKTVKATTGGVSNWSFWQLPWGQIFAWSLLLVLVTSLVIGLVWVFRNTDFDFAGIKQDSRALDVAQGIDEQTQQRIAELPAELRPSGGHPRTDAERFMQSGHFDAAVVCLFSHQLLLLDRAGWLRLARGKTNRRYVSETRSASSDGASVLRHTVDAFERSFFGRHAIVAEEFAELWRLNSELESLVATKVEKAA